MMGDVSWSAKWRKSMEEKVWNHDLRLIRRRQSLGCKRSWAGGRKKKLAEQQAAFCRRLRPTDAAYLAALLDGEGSVVAIKREDDSIKSYRLQVTNTHIGVLNWCKEKTLVGNVNPHTRSKGRKPCYSWQVHGGKASAVGRQLLPYLKIKKDKVLKLIRMFSYE